MIGDLATWQRLLEPGMAELCSAAAAGSSLGVAEIAALRKRFPPDLVAAAAELGEARRRAVAKFGVSIAASLVADREGVEMASSLAISRHKAARFAERVGKGEEVADLCCGIGGDAMGLCAAGIAVVGVDADSVRAWMCGVNARCRTVCARAEEAKARWFHFDPARRSEQGRRTFALDELSPGPEVWRTVIARSQGEQGGRGEGGEGGGGGAIKLGPGVEFAEVRAAIGGHVSIEVEYISEGGRMAQAVAWVGALAGERPVRATTIAAGRVHSIAGEPGDAPLGEIGTHLIEADDAIERAGLLGRLCEPGTMRAFCAGLGLLTGDGPASGWPLTSFEILSKMPWNEKRVRSWLREHDGGLVEVKTRGGAAEPDALQARLRGGGLTPYTLFVLRLGRTLQAFITRRSDGARA